MARVLRSRLLTLKERFAEARADADAADRDVRQASARRLAELQAARHDRALVAGLKDPALTAQDRELLTCTIARRLSRQRVGIPQRVSHTARSVLRHTLSRWQSLVIVVVVASSLAALIGIAAWNSGQQQVWFDTDVTLNFRFRDGHDEAWHFPAGTPFVVTDRLAGVVRLRVWSEINGYGVADIYEGWFDLHAHR